MSYVILTNPQIGHEHFVYIGMVYVGFHRARWYSQRYTFCCIVLLLYVYMADVYPNGIGI